MLDIVLCVLYKTSHLVLPFYKNVYVTNENSDTKSSYATIEWERCSNVRVSSQPQYTRSSIWAMLAAALAYISQQILSQNQFKNKLTDCFYTLFTLFRNTEQI